MAFRQANVFIISDDETAAALVGIVKDVQLKGVPINSSPDTTKRQTTLGYDIEAQFVMMQTSQAERAAMAEMGYPDAASDGQNGFTIFFSESPMTAAAAFAAVALATAGTTAAPGFVMKNAIINPEFEFNMSSDESMITCSIKGAVPASAVGTFADYNILTFDA